MCAQGLIIMGAQNSDPKHDQYLTMTTAGQYLKYQTDPLDYA